MNDIFIEGSRPEVEVVEAVPKMVKETSLSDLERSLLAMVEVSGQEVVLLDDSVVVKGVGGITKTVSYEDFINSVLKATNTLSKESKLTLTLPTSAFFIAVGPTELDISCYYREGIKPFQYMGEGKTEKFDIVVPNIIISHKLKREKNDWVNTNAYYTVTDSPVNKLPTDVQIIRVDHTKGISLMPFTNSYDSCNMCYGGNKMPARFVDNNLRGLDYYYNFLWESPFSNDLGISSKVNIVKFGSPRQWYHHLRDLAKDNKPFPYEHLRR
jgi:hypothetical protein